MENLVCLLLAVILIITGVWAFVAYKRKQKEQRIWEEQRREANMRHWHEDLKRRFGGPAESPTSTMQVISSDTPPSENI
jgi:predicted membrane protein